MEAKEFYVSGLTRMAQADHVGAEAAFRSALGVDAGYVMGYLGLSQALDRQGKVDEAILVVKEAIALDPREPLAHTSLSRLYQQKGLIDEAEVELALSTKLQRESEL